MSALYVYNKSSGELLWNSDDQDKISETLDAVDVRFENWPTSDDIDASTAAEHILQHYQTQINELCNIEGYQTVDVISLASDHPQKAQLRAKFLSEHTHGEDEVRFFVRGEGLFYLHIDDKIYGVHCTQGDLISVPSLTPHWFDMGPNPNFSCIRFFNNPEGWVAKYTGDAIADHYPRMN